MGEYSGWILDIGPVVSVAKPAKLNMKENREIIINKIRLLIL